MTIGLWCVLLVGLLPYVSVGLAKLQGGQYDNRDPRTSAKTYSGLASRAYAAHQNSFEAFPFFAVAVLVAEFKGGHRIYIDYLAVAFVLIRLLYIAFYLADWATLRSIAWVLGIAVVVAIFISPALSF